VPHVPKIWWWANSMAPCGENNKNSMGAPRSLVNIGRV